MPDWTERRLAHESRCSLQAVTASHSHILSRLPIQSWLFFPFLWVLTTAHTVPSHAPTSFVWSKCLIILGFCNLLSKSEAVQYPMGSRVQVLCWQDISAGQCICSRPSSETLSAPSLHYHNALGSVKRPAVIWKGNYLLWNLLKQTKSRRRRGRGLSWCLLDRGELMKRWKILLRLLVTCEQVNGSGVSN